MTTVPHLSNGQKAAAVAALGTISLLGVIGLAVLEFVTAETHSSNLLTAAFTFLCGNVTASISFLMGASRPDESAGPPLPAGSAARVTSSVTAEVAEPATP